MRALVTTLLVGTALLATRPAAADAVLAGLDLFEALPTSSQSFTGPYAIPADFFAPGSDPFTGLVHFQTVPVAFPPGCSLLPASPYVVLRRTADAIFPGGETVPIEIVQLSLVSVDPITVTYGGGAPELWDVAMTVFPGPPGSMTIQHPVPEGGTFTAQFVVQPRFTFTRRDGPGTQFFVPDVGAGEPWNIAPTPWAHAPAAGMVEIPGCTTNFFPGVTPGAELAVESLPPFGPFTILGPSTGIECQWPVTGPTDARAASWGSVKLLYR